MDLLFIADISPAINDLKAARFAPAFRSPNMTGVAISCRVEKSSPCRCWRLTLLLLRLLWRPCLWTLRERLVRPAPKEQPPRKLSGKRTAGQYGTLESGL